jgi:Undecaprenyl-phosphate galactose phosphotransferase WbaP
MTSQATALEPLSEAKPSRYDTLQDGVAQESIGTPSGALAMRAPYAVFRSAGANDLTKQRAELLPASWNGQALKRCLDISLLFLGAAIALPLIGLVALVIKLGSRGPVFFSQERIGRYGRHFRALKFRTMVPNGDDILAAYLVAHPEERIIWRRNRKLKCDPRVTWVGRILRRTSLDELPQLWNVLRGEMSLVGPRPMMRVEIPEYGDQFEDCVQVLPGITGLWQVSGRGDTSFRQRVALDVEYATTRSLWLDLKILFRTPAVVITRKGAY